MQFYSKNQFVVISIKKIVKSCYLYNFSQSFEKNLQIDILAKINILAKQN